MKYLKYIITGILFFGLVKFTAEWTNIKDLKPDTSEDKILIFIGVIIILHLVLMVHELGHLLTGLFQGFKFQLFVVGLLGIKREDEKVKFYLNKNLGYYGGVAGTTPVNDSADNPKKFANILLAGPIASILFALLCLFTANLFGKPWGVVVFTGGLTSIAIFLATTVPDKTGMFFTDRKRYQRLMQPGKDQDVEYALLKIMGTFSKDESYQHVNTTDIETLIADDEPFVNFFGLFNMICWQIEHKGEVTEKIRESYKASATSMPKSLVKAWNVELEKFAQKFNVDFNII